MTGDPHPLAKILADAADGSFPPEDGRVEVMPPLAGGLGAIIAFSWHHVIAADVDPDWVAQLCPRYDLLAPISHGFISALAERTGGTPGVLDLVLAAPSTGSGSTLDLHEVRPAILVV